MATPLLTVDIGPEKPKYGQPCNGCGFCCSTELCTAAIAVHGKDHPVPCPSMEWSNGRFDCGLVRLADSIGDGFGSFLRFSLGIGIGCQVEDITAPSPDSPATP